MKIKLLSIFVLAAVFFAGFYSYSIFMPFDFIPVEKTNESAIIAIPQNVSAREIIRMLKANNIIRNELLARIYLRIKGWDSTLLAGEYEFFSPVSCKEVFRKIHLGEIKGIRITIPEGWTSVEIADLLTKYKLINREKFIELSRAEEGFLFPDTYYFYKGMSEQMIIDSMKEQFNSAILPLFDQRDEEITLNLKECVILASIVEKEANNNERKMVASVFFNRLRKKIKLESCVTVMYALGMHKSSLYKKDLKIDSPYNTYLHYGLPPGPICNPGKSALMSVFNPAKSEYIFFVSRNDGTHEFTRTIEEHLAAKRKFQRIPKKV